MYAVCCQACRLCVQRTLWVMAEMLKCVEQWPVGGIGTLRQRLGGSICVDHSWEFCGASWLSSTKCKYLSVWKMRIYSSRMKYQILLTRRPNLHGQCHDKGHKGHETHRNLLRYRMTSRIALYMSDATPIEPPMIWLEGAQLIALTASEDLRGHQEVDISYRWILGSVDGRQPAIWAIQLLMTRINDGGKIATT